MGNAQPTQREVEMELATVWQPRFEPYREQGGMPLTDLKNQLEQDDHNLPDSIVSQVLQGADTNQNNRMDFNEFREMVLTEQNVVTSSIKNRMAMNYMRIVAGKQQLLDDQYASQYNCMPPPVFILGVTAAELIIFGVYAAELNNSTDQSVHVTWTSGVPLYSPLLYCPSRRYEAWRFITYMFIHQGWYHLISNCFFQLFLGVPLEMVHKWWRVGTIYFLGVMAGSFCMSVFDPYYPLAGASGGGYALIGAHFANIIRNWDEMMQGWKTSVWSLIASPVVQLPLLIIIAGVDTGVALYGRLTATSTNQVGFAAHFGGFAAGLLVGIFVLRNLKDQEWEKIVMIIAIIIYLAFVIFSVLWNAFYTAYFPSTDWDACCHNCRA